MKQILLIAGARPNFIKLAPLYDALRARPESYTPVVVHTGQHYDQEMSDVFIRQLEIPEPDINLGIGSGTHGFQTGKVMIEIEKVMMDREPDMVVVFGDVNSTLAAAIASVKLGISVAHVEAGLRSCDWSMPEEINRIVADRVSELLLTTCESANINLLREGVSEDAVHFVGNVMIDSLVKYLPKADKLDVLSECDVEKGQYVLVTMHRPGNVDDGEQLSKMIEMLSGLAKIAPVIFPMHPRTRKRLLEFELSSGDNSVFEDPNLRVVKPLGYLEFLKLQKEAAVVVTDSGGVQEETTYLGVRCLTVRRNTERPVTITDGTNSLIGLRPEQIVREADKCLQNGFKSSRRPLLWDGKAAGRIVEVLDKHFGMEAPLSAIEEKEAASVRH